MPGNGVNITVSGEQAIMQRLAKIKTPQLDKVLMAVGSHMRKLPVDAIREAKDPVTGKPWLALSPLTILSRPKGTSNQLQDTGLLVRSITSAPIQIDGNSVSIATNRPQARILQEGGTVKPVKAKFLTVPLNRQAKRVGARATINAGGFFLKSKKGNLLIGHKNGKNGKLVIDFWLTDKVTIPARRYFGFGAAAKKEIAGIVRGWLKSDIIRND